MLKVRAVYRDFEFYREFTTDLLQKLRLTRNLFSDIIRLKHPLYKERMKTSMKKIVIPICLVLLALFSSCAASGKVPSSENPASQAESGAPVNKSLYKECSYKELIEDNGTLKGGKVAFGGKIISYADKGSHMEYHINITKDELGDWYDTVVVSLPGGEELFGKEVAVYGTLTGITSYALVMGMPSDVPAVAADMME